MRASTYFAGWGIAEQSDIPDGHYEVSHDIERDLFVAKLSDRVAIVPRPKKKDDEGDRAAPEKESS